MEATLRAHHHPSHSEAQNLSQMGFWGATRTSVKIDFQLKDLVYPQSPVKYYDATIILTTMMEPNMDKEWLNFPRASQAYHQGVNRFLDFAFRNVGTSSGEILCPCTRCVNGLFQKRETVEEHLVMRGFANHYRIWTDHGEVIHGEVQGEGNTPLNDVDNRDPVHEVEVDRMPELVNDVLRNQLQDDPCTKAAKFEKYMNEANQELYPGC
ncbi:hypothetical protein RJ639_023054, partial [Escallonia herrerae]